MENEKKLNEEEIKEVNGGQVMWVRQEGADTATNPIAGGTLDIEGIAPNIPTETNKVNVP